MFSSSEGQALGLSQSQNAELAGKTFFCPSSLSQQHRALGVWQSPCGSGHRWFVPLEAALQAELSLWTWFYSFPGENWWTLLCWLLPICNGLGCPASYSTGLSAGHSGNPG